MSRAVMQQALEALEIGYDSAKAEADQFHSAMAGYKPQRHAQMDADVQTIANAITALKQALAEPDQEPQTTHWEGCEAVHPECRKPDTDCHAQGITTRDYFAAKAMQTDDYIGECIHELEFALVAKRAYKIADAMLKAREASNGQD